MRRSDGRFAAFHLLTEREERRRGGGRQAVNAASLSFLSPSYQLFLPPFLLLSLLLSHSPLPRLLLLLLGLVNSFCLSSSFNWSLAGHRPHLGPQQHVSQTHKQTQANNGSILSVCLCVVVNYQRRADVDYGGRFVR